jgi:signal transduction histidine kinase
MTTVGDAAPTSQELLDDLRRERERSELRTRFLSLVGHEFRTPLTVIMSSCELLESYGDDWPAPRRRTHYQRIQGSVATMTALLDNVTLLSRIESGRYESAAEPIHLPDLLAGLVEDASVLRKPGQEIVPSFSGEDSIRIDHRLLRAAGTNLLSNALRFSPESSRIEISLERSGEGLRLSVLDRGPGIPVADRERLWEAFERGGNAAGVPGSGLGLPIARRCALLCGGEAVLSDREGGGLSAVVTVPEAPA